MNGLKYVRPGEGFEPNFPLTAKSDVNGDTQHPLYMYLKSVCPPVDRELRQPILYSPVYTEDIRWNFEKFLIGPDGRPIYRYSISVDPRTDSQLKSDIASEIKKLSSGNGTIVD